VMPLADCTWPANRQHHLSRRCHLAVGLMSWLMANGSARNARCSLVKWSPARMKPKQLLQSLRT